MTRTEAYRRWDAACSVAERMYQRGLITATELVSLESDAYDQMMEEIQ